MRMRELRVSYGQAKTCRPVDGPVRIREARDVVSEIGPLLEVEVCEVGYVVCLSSKREVIGCHEISRGALDSTTIHPRETFKAAVLTNAAAIILVHNHPSGDPSPSQDDVALTGRIKDAGELLGIELLDHIIIGERGRYVSLREHGVGGLS